MCVCVCVNTYVCIVNVQDLDRCLAIVIQDFRLMAVFGKCLEKHNNREGEWNSLYFHVSSEIEFIVFWKSSFVNHSEKKIAVNNPALSNSTGRDYRITSTLKTLSTAIYTHKVLLMLDIR